MMITVHTWLTTAIKQHLSWNGKHTEVARADYQYTSTKNMLDPEKRKTETLLGIECL